MAREQQKKWTMGKSARTISNLEVGKGQKGQEMSHRAICLTFLIPWSHYMVSGSDSSTRFGNDCIPHSSFLPRRLLILVVGFCPLLLEYIIMKIHQNSYTWELSPDLYFLAPGQQPRDPLTQLLIINKTGNHVVHMSFPGAFAVQGVAQKTSTRQRENEPLTFSACVKKNSGSLGMMNTSPPKNRN